MPRPPIRHRRLARAGAAAALALAVAAPVLAGTPAAAEPRRDRDARATQSETRSETRSGRLVSTSGRGSDAGVAQQRGDQRGDQPATASRNRAENYRVKTGVLVSNPLRESAERRVIANIVNSIKSTRGTQKIRIMTWNLASPTVVRELIDANARGVSVRLLMSEGKAQGNADFARLRNGLKQRSTRHPQPDSLRSWARACDRSCRGKRGIAHSKFFIFSQVGKARRNVSISTSANATEVSANSQWNDSFTLVGNKKIYDSFFDVFRQAAKDRPVRRGYRTTTAKTIQSYFYPWKGAAARGDRVINTLRRIDCRGAQGRTGINGKTRIRIAQDAIIDDRGILIAKKLRSMYENGCNIKIAYALMGRQVRYIVTHTSRGPIPIRQIVQDFNGDYVYERYLHAKVLAVSGVYGKDRSARIAWQGSENWSGLAKISDEQGLRIKRNGAEGAYARWVDYLYSNPPPRGSAREVAARESSARAQGIDPYALIREELVG